MDEKVVTTAEQHPHKSALIHRIQWWRFFFYVLLLIAVILLGLLTYKQWAMDQRMREQMLLVQQLTHQLSEQQEQQNGLSDQMAHLTQTMHDVVHAKDAERLYMRSSALSFVQYIALASDALSMSKDPGQALFFLTQAQSLLTTDHLPSDFSALSTALNHDIARLKPMLNINWPALYEEWRSLLFLVDHLPDAFSPHILSSVHNDTVSDQSSSAMNGLSWAGIGAHFSSLFAVRRFAPVDLLSPNEIFYLRRYVRVLLLNARFELEAGEMAAFTRDISAVRSILLHYYRPASIQGLLDLTAQMMQMPLPQEWPNLLVTKKMAFDIFYRFLHA